MMFNSVELASLILIAIVVIVIAWGQFGEE